MIIDVWKPRFGKVNDVKVVIHYELTETEILKSEKKTGWVVRYNCDRCSSSTVHTTTSHTFFNENVKYNTLEYQICRSCRSSISENEIKKSFIDYSTIKQSIEEYNYSLLTDNNSYYNANYKSQFKLNVICDNGHNMTTTWNNWSRGKRCRECYEKNKFDSAVKYKNGWDRYKFLVHFYTEKTYKEYKDIINPNNYKRGNKYNLDHKYSIYEGFINNVSPKIIASVKNLEVIPRFDNMSKGKKCSINLNEIIN